MYVVWTSEAIARLEDIETYIAQDSPENAKEMVAVFLRAHASLRRPL